ncbi:hypothetical protein DSL92_06765 [Billgrantia gudaonensis]|uniref:Uncharacterized protein n=1 Tax=Billgrantia gudaonensis TaxID=376427 RepID=A0A432JII3_9GAMM|nr:hypothetical protein DSL92_06765 [Halomonas gudaonensis]
MADPRPPRHLAGHRPLKGLEASAGQLLSNGESLTPENLGDKLTALKATSPPSPFSRHRRPPPKALPGEWATASYEARLTRPARRAVVDRQLLHWHRRHPARNCRPPQRALTHLSPGESDAS